MRPMIVGLCALLVLVGVALADEVKGKVKSVDAAKRSITLQVDEKERTYAGTDDLKVVTSMKGKIKDVPGGLGGIKAGDVVTLTIVKKDDKLVITQVLLDTPKKK
jgi:Cu/Ag efflux protein CusF